jgi:ribosomal protein S18 acetylase RimI-like enzyme
MQFIELTHTSSEFDAAYDIFRLEISPKFLETKEFLRNRFRVRDEGPKSKKEKILVQDGYTLHLIVAKEGNKVLGVIYGHLISKIDADNKAVGFVTYIAVLPEYRRKGIGIMLIAELKKRIEQDATNITGKPVVGTVFEIEEHGKTEIKRFLQKHGGWPSILSIISLPFVWDINRNPCTYGFNLTSCLWNLLNKRKKGVFLGHLLHPW